MLTDKQQKQFVDWYIERYYKNYEWEKPYPLPHVPVENKKEEIEAWRDFLEKLIWPKKSKQTYKIRPYGKQSILNKVFSSLRLQYWPVFDWETCESVNNDVFDF